MADIKKIREAVETLSTITDSEWEKIEKTFSKEMTIKGEVKSESKTKRKVKDLSSEEKEKIISELLKQVGVPTHFKGYEYTKYAIILFIDDTNTYLSGITKVLYPTIAKKFNSTSYRVERAIRHAIEVAWERGNTNMHKQIFGSTVSGKPTNSEAISAFAEYIKFNMV